jgi:hypothetical protein
LPTFEQPQRQEFRRKLLPAVALPVAEAGQRLLGAGRTELARLAFIHRECLTFLFFQAKLLLTGKKGI